MESRTVDTRQYSVEYRDPTAELYRDMYSCTVRSHTE
eukprot:COSAG05_NODE_17034_length_333_cov_0.820513_1_plen_36_part_01